MIDDAELLRRYIEGRSQAAFSELVHRHIALVYGAALRRLGGNSHHAEEVTQAVFISLARKAASLARHPSLLGWLHTSTRYAAVDLLRKEQRRATHEQAWVDDPATATVAADAAAEWDRLRPWIDAALDDLDQRDRDAVLLRYFAGRSWAEIGARLKLSEDASRKRVSHALERIRGHLARQGVTSSATALSIALAQLPAVAVPSQLAPTIVAGALSAAGTGGALTLMSALTTLMTTAKMHVGLTVLTAITVVATGSMAMLSDQPSPSSAAAAGSNHVASASTTLPTASTSTTAAAPATTPATSNSAPSASAAPTGATTAPANAASKVPLRVAVAEILDRNPEYVSLRHQKYRLRAERDFGPFAAAQALSPKQTEKLYEILARKQELQEWRNNELAKNGPRAGADVSVSEDGGFSAAQMMKPDSPEAAIIAELKNLLGDPGYAAFAKYDKNRMFKLPALFIALELQDNQQPITTAQQKQLQDILADVRLYPGSAYKATTSLEPSATELDVVARASTFLNPAQVELLKAYLVDMRRGAAMRGHANTTTFVGAGVATPPQPINGQVVSPDPTMATQVNRDHFDTLRTTVADDLRTSPEYTANLRRKARRRVLWQNADVFTALALPADKLESLKQLLVEEQIAGADISVLMAKQGLSDSGSAANQAHQKVTEETNAKVKALLGDKGYADYREQQGVNSLRKLFLNDCYGTLAQRGLPALDEKQLIACARVPDSIPSSKPATREEWATFVQSKLGSVLTTAQCDVFFEQFYIWMRTTTLMRDATRQAMAAQAR